ncbi:MAG: hypothetical protein ACR2M1_05275 [Gemmatimonadaceae bacterium]
MAVAAAVTPTVLPISIGQASIAYRLYETNAPPSYDGFRSLTVYDSGPGPDRARYVLIEDDQLAWHLDRYASGLHRAVPSDVFDSDDLARRIFDAIRAGMKDG